ncbi:hypothetical protein GCM10010129_00640 [Streptomyces fumigatiscleroticus]|nr:hypothetical protein GCM10010129_00640 [Streptomyces fumigatiscleroticus]
MRRIVFALAAAVAVTAASAPVASAYEPPYPYENCLAGAKQLGESPSHAKWHCDGLVRKGWFLPPVG